MAADELPGGVSRDVMAAAIAAAEEAGIIPCGGIWGQLVMPDPTGGACCIGCAVNGPQYCTCWVPVLEPVQQPVRAGEPGRRTSPCHDCAYRKGSPERRGDERYKGDGAFLDRIAAAAERFWCHQGMRHAVKLVHPSGAEVSLLEKDPPGDYRPPVIDGIPYKADGTPGDLCAGWDARRRWHERQEARTP